MAKINSNELDVVETLIGIDLRDRMFIKGQKVYIEGCNDTGTIKEIRYYGRFPDGLFHYVIQLHNTYHKVMKTRKVVHCIGMELKECE